MLYEPTLRLRSRSALVLSSKLGHVVLRTRCDIAHLSRRRLGHIVQRTTVTALFSEAERDEANDPQTLY